MESTNEDGIHESSEISPYWPIIRSLSLIAIFAFLSWFCVSTYAWAEADRGNITFTYDNFFVPKTNFIVVFIFSFIFLIWQRVIKIKLLLPLFLVIGIAAFTIFSSLQNAERLEKLGVLERYQPFRKAINSQNWEEAYTFMYPDYRENHTVEEFEEDFLFLLHRIDESNHLDEITIYAIHLSGESAWIAPFDDISKEFHRRSGNGLNLIKIDGQWYFEENTIFFIN